MKPASPLVTSAELAERLGAGERLTVLDVRWSLTGPPGRTAYERGHVPSAQFVDLQRDLAGPPGARGRHPLPDAGRFVAAMRLAGVSSDVPVVVYDQRDGSSAARAWWLLRHYGHRDVRLLDGGFDGWVGGGGASSVTSEACSPGNFDGVPGSMRVIVASEVLPIAAAGMLLDARAPERYRGESEPVDPVAGHVPGAVNAPTGANVGDDGHWREADELRERFAGLGVTGQPVAVYCGSGVTAAQGVLALEIAGVASALYAGSWSEWITDPDRPVATGSAP